MTPDLSNAHWRKSTRSQNGGNCVEVAPLAEVIAVRDSKDPSGSSSGCRPISLGRVYQHDPTQPAGVDPSDSIARLTGWDESS